MKDILKMKFKAHRLVNYLFYMIIFFIGFFVGFGAKNLNIKNIINQVLFIDNVEAKTMATVNGTAIDEEYIYNRFIEKWKNFDIKKYNKISCGWFNNTTKSLYCVALTTDTFNNKTFVSKDTNVPLYDTNNVFKVTYSVPNNKTNAYEFLYETATNTFSSSKFYDSSTVSDSNLNYFNFYFNNWVASETGFSNFDVDEITSSDDELFNSFDFSSYINKKDDEDSSDGGYTLATVDSIVINEDYIYNEFKKLWSDFDIKIYNNIYCELSETNNKYRLLCRAFTESSKNSFECSGNSCSIKNKKLDMYEFEYNFYTKLYNTVNFVESSKQSSDDSSGYFFYPKSMKHSDTYYTIATNYDRADLSDEENKAINKFTKYTLNYHLNDGSIFEDENHQDFNKVCWENFDELLFAISIDKSYDGSYTIIEDGQQDGETYIKSGFYVFDDVSNLQRGTRTDLTGEIDSDIYSSTFLSGFKFSNLKKITNTFTLLDTDKKLNIRYSDVIDALGNYDLERGDSYYYDNLSKLKNSTYVDFTYYYNVLNDYKYDIFDLKSKKDKFCIYIPKQFKDKILKLNELGGLVGDVPLHNDTSDSYVDRTEINSKMSFSTLFSIINKFINSIKSTVNFINSNIYSFFLDLPPLLQMFIYTILTLIVIRTILWMVMR